LLYLKLIIENLDQAEEFIQVKSLFLTLQILLELKMPNSAKPIIDLLEVKQVDFERNLELKRLNKVGVYEE
jgi:hypothetical protein